jgi:hypothetical protein
LQDLTASYTPYKAKMRVYGHVPTNQEEDDGNLYANPMLPAAHAQQPIRSFPSLNPSGNNNDLGALSEDCTDDYAEPQLSAPQLLAPSATCSQYRATGTAHSTSYSENIYAQAFPPSPPLPPTGLNGTAVRHQPTLKSAAASSTNHYSKPQLPLPSPPPPHMTASHDESRQPFLLGYSPPRRFSPPSPLATRRKRLSPPRTLNLQSVYGTSGRRGGSKTALAPPAAIYSSSQPDIYSPVASVPLAHEAGGNSLISPSQSSLSSSLGERFYARPADQQPPLYSKVSKTRSSPAAAAGNGGTITTSTASRARSHSASHTDHNKGGRESKRKWRM